MLIINKSGGSVPAGSLGEAAARRRVQPRTVFFRSHCSPLERPLSSLDTTTLPRGFGGLDGLAGSSGLFSRRSGQAAACDRYRFHRLAAVQVWQEQGLRGENDAGPLRGNRRGSQI